MSAWSGIRTDEAAKEVPLIGIIASARCFVEKAAMIAAAQADTELLREQGLYEGTVADVTGYFMRRSGAKELARRGLPLSRIQWYGRWGSAAVLGYVEEAAEECSELRGPEATWDEVRVELATVIRATTSLEGFHIQPMTLLRILAMPAVKEALEKLGAMEERITELTRFVESAVASASGAEDLAKELHRELHPEVVINTATKTLHITRFGVHAATTALACGWSWTGSSDAQPVHPVWAERDAHSWTLCHRCAPGLQRLAQEPEWQALTGLPLHRERHQIRAAGGCP